MQCHCKWRIHIINHFGEIPLIPGCHYANLQQRRIDCSGQASTIQSILFNFGLSFLPMNNPWNNDRHQQREQRTNRLCPSSVGAAFWQKAPTGIENHAKQADKSNQRQHEQQDDCANPEIFGHLLHSSLCIRPRYPATECFAINSSARTIAE